MMKKLLLALFPLCLAGCSSNGGDDEPFTPSPEPSPKETIRFSGDISPMSRATESNFENGDAISVFAIERTSSNTDGKLQTKNYADNVKYTYSGSFFMSSTPIEPLDNGAAIFYRAVYPYQPAAENSFSFDVQKDQNAGENYTNSDLMTASTDATTETVPNLSFYHRLTNIIVNIKYESKPSGAENLKFTNVRTRTLCNLNDNTFKPSGSAGEVKAATNGTDSYKVILAPQTVAKGARIMSLTVGSKNYYWEVNRDLEWKSGKQYIYELTVKKTGEIVFTADINPWGTEQDIEEIVPPAILDKMERYIPIYRGKTPPNVEGCYYIDPMEAVYCEDQGNGGYAPGDQVVSKLLRFSNQDNRRFTLDYEDKSTLAHSVGTGAFISGSGNDFTVYFDTEGVSYDIKTKTALVISGTKTSSGIKNLRYAFVLVEKGYDPDGVLMNEGIFRVFKDSDELASNYNWNAFAKKKGKARGDSYTAPWTEYIKTVK